MTYIRTIVTSSFGERLEKLIKLRLEPGADKDRIDQRIWDLFGEDWCVMYTDLSGFSRNVSEYGIIHFLQTIFESHRVFTPVIEEHDGILLKIEGDSLMVIFRNIEKAFRCAQGLMGAARAYNASRQPEEQILPCIGLGFGKCLRIGDADIFGMEVNSACKLGEDVAKAWEIIVTGSVHAGLASIPGISFTEASDLPSGIDRAFKASN